MNSEYEDYGDQISKINRRSVQERESEKQVHHMFKTIQHVADRNSVQRRRHEMEKKAAKRRR